MLILAAPRGIARTHTRSKGPARATHRPLVLLEHGLEAQEGHVEHQQAQAWEAKAQHGAGTEGRVEPALEAEALF